MTGQTAIDFIRDVRMKKAAQLLATSSLKISEIAFKVGIEDLKRFRTTFQKVYSMSPSEYAKKHRGIQANCQTFSDLSLVNDLVKQQF